MSQIDSAVTKTLDSGVLHIRLNHPKVNAMRIEMVESLLGLFHQAERDTEVRCVLLSAEGSVFSAGQDMHEIKSAQGTSFRGHLLRTYNPLILQIRGLPKPVLAAINGPVSGAALGIVLACDLRIAAENARFVVGFSGIGLGLDSGVSLLLPAMIGLGRASEYAFTNTPIDAKEALRLGLVNRVVPSDALDEHCGLVAAALAQGPVGAMGLAKRAFNKAVLPNLEQALDYEAYLQDVASQSEEHRQGVQAFFEKQAPVFYPPK